MKAPRVWTYTRGSGKFDAGAATPPCRSAPKSNKPTRNDIMVSYLVESSNEDYVAYYKGAIVKAAEDLGCERLPDKHGQCVFRPPVGGAKASRCCMCSWQSLLVGAVSLTGTAQPQPLRRDWRHLLRMMKKKRRMKKKWRQSSARGRSTALSSSE